MSLFTNQDGIYPARIQHGRDLENATSANPESGPISFPAVGSSATVGVAEVPLSLTASKKQYANFNYINWQ